MGGCGREEEESCKEAQLSEQARRPQGLSGQHLWRAWTALPTAHCHHVLPAGFSPCPLHADLGPQGVLRLRDAACTGVYPVDRGLNILTPLPGLGAGGLVSGALDS